VAPICFHEDYLSNEEDGRILLRTCLSNVILALAAGTTSLFTPHAFPRTSMWSRASKRDRGKGLQARVGSAPRDEIEYDSARGEWMQFRVLENKAREKALEQQTHSEKACNSSQASSQGARSAACSALWTFASFRVSTPKGSLTTVACNGVIRPQTQQLNDVTVTSRNSR
jgi:hypothetical protein